MGSSCAALSAGLGCRLIHLEHTTSVRANTSAKHLPLLPQDSANTSFLLSRQRHRTVWIRRKNPSTSFIEFPFSFPQAYFGSLWWILFGGTRGFFVCVCAPLSLNPQIPFPPIYHSATKTPFLPSSAQSFACLRFCFRIL